MPKLAVLSIAIGDHYQKVSTITFPTIRAYAEKINADFIAVTEQKIAETPNWEKFQLFDLLGIYERIIYLDADTLVRKCCPNLFDIVPLTHLGVFDEAPFRPNRGRAIERSADEYNCRDFKWNGKYYNTGVMVVSRRHRLLFRKPEREIGPLESDYINVEIQRKKPLIEELDYKFNRMSCLDRQTGRHRYESYIIHYSGMGEAQIFIPLAADAAEIEKLPDNYRSPKYIWVRVEGGLGDQIQAEPVIRFAIKHIWPAEADVRLSTHYPEIFSHLPVRAALYGTALWNDVNSEPLLLETLPGMDREQWKIISHPLCHTVDYTSMSLLGRVLPDIDKTCHAEVDPKDMENVMEFAKRDDFSDCVMIHAGRHQEWETKSFPPEWWQAVSDGIIDLGLTPVFAGRDIENRGVIPLDGRGRAIDLTNMLTNNEFIASISLMPILISNDSAPVHLAGAFDNWIILIPTCKHPDHILPYRHGTKTYKTAALYKKLALDDMCIEIAELTPASTDKLQGPWERYLPEIQTVLDKIKEINNS